MPGVVIAEEQLGKKQALTLSQLASYDDLITDALVDRVYFWTTIRKNRARYFACRGIREEEVADIIRQALIVEKDAGKGASQILNLTGLRRYYDALHSDNERENFTRHLRKYVNIYLPDAPFEVSTTNRYTIDTQEASISARRDIQKGEMIKYLCGIQIPMTKDEEKNLDLTRRDFSIVMSSRKRVPSLFMGPARFANHDCDANARLQTHGSTGMNVVAVKDIKLGDEITVSYGEDYFGIDNCECLCATCEKLQRNGWIDENADPAVDDAAIASGPDDDLIRTTRMSSRNRPISRPASQVRLLTKKRKADSSDSESPPARARGRPRKVAKMSSNLQHELRPEELDNDTATPRGRSLQRSDTPDAEAIDPAEHTTPRGRSLQRAMPPPALSATFSQTLTRLVTKMKEKITEYENLNPNHYTDHTAFVAEQLRKLDDVRFLAELCEFELGPSDYGRLREEIPFLKTLPNQSTSVEPASTSPRVRDHAGKFIPRTNSILLPAKPKPAESPVSVAKGPISPVSSEHSQSQGTDENKTDRTPGDYTLTIRLLCTPHSRWVQCRVCDEAFVQAEAFNQTRYACPRCERHSKLYGYKWPKTDKIGKHDTEERITDHRTVHRFVFADEEKDIRKGKRSALQDIIAERERSPSPMMVMTWTQDGGRKRGLESSALEETRPKKRGRPRKSQAEVKQEEPPLKKQRYWSRKKGARSQPDDTQPGKHKYRKSTGTDGLTVPESHKRVDKKDPARRNTLPKSKRQQSPPIEISERTGRPKQKYEKTGKYAGESARRRSLLQATQQASSTPKAAKSPKKAEETESKRKAEERALKAEQKSLRAEQRRKAAEQAEELAEQKRRAVAEKRKAEERKAEEQKKPKPRGYWGNWEYAPVEPRMVNPAVVESLPRAARRRAAASEGADGTEDGAEDRSQDRATTYDNSSVNRQRAPRREDVKLEPTSPGLMSTPPPSRRVVDARSAKSSERNSRGRFAARNSSGRFTKVLDRPAISADLFDGPVSPEQPRVSPEQVRTRNAMSIRNVLNSETSSSAGHADDQHERDQRHPFVPAEPSQAKRAAAEDDEDDEDPVVMRSAKKARPSPTVLDSGDDSEGEDDDHPLRRSVRERRMKRPEECRRSGRASYRPIHIPDTDSSDTFGSSASASSADERPSERAGPANHAAGNTAVDADPRDVNGDAAAEDSDSGESAKSVETTISEKWKRSVLGTPQDKRRWLDFSGGSGRRRPSVERG